MNRMRIWMVLSFVLLLLPGACQQTQEPTRTVVADPDSVLLPILLQPEDFSPEWVWFSQDTYQSNAGSGDSGRWIEKASVTRAGRLEGTRDFVILYEGLIRYAERLDPLSLELSIDDPAPSDPFAIAIGSYGSDTRSLCSAHQDGSLKTCKAAVGYAKVAHTLSIVLNPGTASNQQLEQELDAWLKVCDQRILELEKTLQ